MQFDNLNISVDTNAPGYTSRTFLQEYKGGGREVEEPDVNGYEPLKYQETDIMWGSNVQQRYSVFYYVNPAVPNSTIATSSVGVSPQDFVRFNSVTSK